MVNEEEDARLLDRCEAKMKELSKHWQCGEVVQNVQEKPWKSEEMRKLDEALPQPKRMSLWEKCQGCIKHKNE